MREKRARIASLVVYLEKKNKRKNEFCFSIIVVVACILLPFKLFCLLLYSFSFLNLSSPSRSLCIMSDMKRLFYVWFLGAKECRGLRGDEFVRPIVRYVHFPFRHSYSSACVIQILALLITGLPFFFIFLPTHHSPCKGLITSCFSFFFFL